MKIETKIQKIENKYNIKVLKLDIENDYILVTDNEYEYEFKYLGISKFRKSTRSMTKESYIKYYNNKFTKDTNYTAIDLIDDYIVIRNNINNKTINHYKYNFNIDRLDSLTTKEDNHINFVKNKFGNKYDYSKLKFEGIKSDATLICPLHGEFKISWNNLIYSDHQGCTLCSYGKRKFGKKGFIEACINNDVKGVLYLIQMYDNNESFFKIGITSNINRRYSKFPYDINEILLLEYSPDIIYDLERLLHKKYSKDLYIPKKNFNGRLECFKFDNIEYIKDEILEISNNFLKHL